MILFLPIQETCGFGWNFKIALAIRDDLTRKKRNESCAFGDVVGKAMAVASKIRIDVPF